VIVHSARDNNSLETETIRIIETEGKKCKREKGKKERRKQRERKNDEVRIEFSREGEKEEESQREKIICS
jgi:hypothetical protein